MRWLVLFIPFVLLSCAGGKKLSYVKENRVTADVAVGSLDDVSNMSADIADDVGEVETVEVEDLDGNRIVMNAVKDEQTGEMVAQEFLNEIVVQARFSHVAERNGSVDLVFELAVPSELQQRRWQVRLFPKYICLEDTLGGDAIYVTGEKFRKRQNWEYMMYNNYLSRIVPEEIAGEMYSRDIMRERFVTRNGDNPEAGDYYRKSLMEKMNHNKEKAKGAVYERFVVDPFPNGGVRLDSVIRGGEGEAIRYFYVQTIAAKGGLRRVDMVLEGQVHANGRKLCDLAAAEPITFYISSISTLADTRERYLKKIVYRDLHYEASYNIAFAKGDWRVEPELEENGRVMDNIRDNFIEIFANEEFVVDSILVAAACSPEGKSSVNDKLSSRRGESMKGYLKECMAMTADSLRRSVWVIDAAGEDKGNGANTWCFDEKCIRITEVSEDWERLYHLMETDTLLQGKGLVERCMAVSDLDEREKLLVSGVHGAYIKEVIYPKLRRVKFNFKLHRKGMIKDTIHTTELDTVYMRGVEALKNRDYKTAVTLLRPYNCYNSAVAYMCMGYDNSALEILNMLPRDARRDYMLAVVYGRLGEEQKAVEFFLNSVMQDEAMRHRGNLDPEISNLIKKYGIFNN